MKKLVISIFLTLALANGLFTSLFAQESKSTGMENMPGMSSVATDQAMHSMEGQHMNMGPHMKMTALRAAKPGDDERAQQIVETARKVAEKYSDYRVALANGFHIFMPDVPQHQYHFNNVEYAHEAVEHFNPEHPTSLLYEKDGTGYKLVGVMYTAAKWTSVDELDQRVPLSVAQWHEHVNICIPPSGADAALGHDGRFGFRGSISTQAQCDAAGGRFAPQIFGWMVHVYPFEQTAEKIWSVERQEHGEN